MIFIIGNAERSTMLIPFGPSLIKAYFRSADAITSRPPEVTVKFSTKGLKMSFMLIVKIPVLREAASKY